MRDKPKSTLPWFRFHLLTAVVFVVVAGALLGANMKGLTLSGPPAVPQGAKIIGLVEYGFPIRVYLHVTAISKDGLPYEKFGSDGSGLFVNFAIPFFVSSIAEYLIRRRENRKQ